MLLVDKFVLVFSLHTSERTWGVLIVNAFVQKVCFSKHLPFSFCKFFDIKDTRLVLQVQGQGREKNAMSGMVLLLVLPVCTAVHSCALSCSAKFSKCTFVVPCAVAKQCTAV